MSNTEKLAAIRIRGDVHLSAEIRSTLRMLHLHRKNYCVVYERTAPNEGMLKKVKDHITWGEIDGETLTLLREKRLEKTKDRQGKTIEKRFFRLHPPRGGFERRGIKISFQNGGALGYRKDKINGLIKKMI